MAEDYTEERDDAEELIQEFGSAAKLYKETTSGGSSYTPGSGTTQVTSDDIFAVIIDYTIKEREDGNIEKGDQRALVSAPAGVTVPDTGTVLRFDVQGQDVDYQIKEADVLRPGGPNGIAVLFDLRVRGA